MVNTCTKCNENQALDVEVILWNLIVSTHSTVYGLLCYRVKSGMFGQTAKLGQRSCLFHTSIIGIKNKLTIKANSENPDETAHKEPSHLDFHCLQMCVQIYLMSKFTL